MPNQIDEKIDKMAEKLEKSTMDPKEKLIKTIETLGKSGLKDRIQFLNSDERVLLKAALEEMALKKAKSVEFDKESQSAKVIQGNIMDTILQEEIGSDDADEKLMKLEAAKHSHQGNSVEGWEGQVIKAKAIPVEKKTTKEEEKLQEEEEQEVGNYKVKKGGEAFKKLKNELSHEKGVNDPAGLAAKIGREKMGKEAFDKKAAEGKKKMKKSSLDLIEEMKKSEELLIKCMEGMYDKGLRKKSIKSKLQEKGIEKSMIEKAMAKSKMGKEEAKDKLMEMEEKEHGTKNPKKLVEAEKKEQKMKKSDSEHDKGHILEEENQLGDTDQMTEDKKKLKDDDNLHTGEDNKKVQDEVNSMKVQKSFSWTTDQELLKANTLGRNFNFNVGDFVESMIKADEIIKAAAKDKKMKDEENKEDEIQEKEGKKEHKIKKSDLNELIAKGEDTTWDAEAIKKSLQNAAENKTGKLVKSFDDVKDMAVLLGISEEEAKKIIG